MGDGLTAALARLAGSELAVSGWETLDQERVDRHAETTGDAQWIHNDPERARREGPFGGPIVQGFLLLSLFTRLAESALTERLTRELGGDATPAYLVNYGFDRVRFVAPVPVGARVRARVALRGTRAAGAQRTVVTVDVTLEQETGAGPVTAVVAEWLFLAA